MKLELLKRVLDRDSVSRYRKMLLCISNTNEACWQPGDAWNRKKANNRLFQLNGGLIVLSITLGRTWNTHFDSGREEVPQNLYNVVASKEEVEICGPNLRSLNLGRLKGIEHWLSSFCVDQGKHTPFMMLWRC